MASRSKQIDAIDAECDEISRHLTIGQVLTLSQNIQDLPIKSLSIKQIELLQKQSVLGFLRSLSVEVPTTHQQKFLLNQLQVAAFRLIDILLGRDAETQSGKIIEDIKFLEKTISVFKSELG
jgi:hypothetical protein